MTAETPIAPPDEERPTENAPAPADRLRRGAEWIFVIGLVVACAISFGISHEFHRAATTTSGALDEAGFPLDDAWIHQVYARSVARTGTFEYNPGERETGISSPLFAILLAPLHGDDAKPLAELVLGVRRTGAAIWCALILACALLARAIPSASPRLAGVAAALLVALDPKLAFAAASGMEPLLAAALLIVAVERTIRESYLAAGIACGLALLARPEAIVAAPLLAIAASWAARSRISSVAKILAPVALAAACWAWYCTSVTGRPFPNTFYAKAESIDFGVAATQWLTTWKTYFAHSPYYRIPTTYFLVVMALVGVFARGGRRIALPLLGVPILFVAAIAATRALPLPDAFYWSRYTLPAEPFATAILGLGIGVALAETFSIAQRRVAAAQQGLQVPAPITSFVLFLLAILPFGAVADALRVKIESFARQVADVDRTNVAAARWLETQSNLPTTAVVAAQDAGAVRYFGSRPVIDLLGLNDHRVITSMLAGGGEAVREYLDARAPTAYFLLDPDSGATDFVLYAVAHGTHPMQRFEAPEYSLFGAPQRKGVVLFLPGR